VNILILIITLLLAMTCSLLQKRLDSQIGMIDLLDDKIGILVDENSRQKEDIELLGEGLVKALEIFAEEE